MAIETLTSSASVGTLARLEALWRRLGGDAGVEDLLSGRSRIIYNTPRPRATGDVVINVSRQEIPDAYNPDPSFKEWAFPELMGNGPTIYGLSQIDLWMHPDQAPMEGTVTGTPNSGAAQI